jgi:hypothetical protein
VARCYWPLPVRPDRAVRPLDLKTIERLRSDGTLSLIDLIWPIRSRSNSVGVDREKLTGEGRRRRGRAAQARSLAVLRLSPAMVVWQTGSPDRRRSREYPLRQGMLPGTTVASSWS